MSYLNELQNLSVTYNTYLRLWVTRLNTDDHPMVKIIQKLSFHNKYSHINDIISVITGLLIT